MGLSPKDALSEKQYRQLLSGGGIGGSRDAAKIIDACLIILTNTKGRPMFGDSVVGSYGLYVNKQGMLQSPANASAPTRQVNALIAPGGYVGNWLRANGATHTLLALYRSAYTIEIPFGFVSQQMSGAAQLVTNTKGGVTSTVGMSMAPPLWLVNFALLYIVKPSLAAAMPAYWAPIPQPVAAAIKASPTGQVPWSKYRSYFECVCYLEWVCEDCSAAGTWEPRDEPSPRPAPADRFTGEIPAGGSAERDGHDAVTGCGTMWGPSAPRRHPRRTPRRRCAWSRPRRVRPRAAGDEVGRTATATTW